MFSSQACGDAGEDSDVDIVLDVKDGFSLFDLCGISNNLSDLLRTRVDVVTREGLKPRIRENAERDEILIYECT